MDNYILAYYQAINDGSVVVGKWVRLVYAYIVKGLEEKKFFYDAKKADRAIRFIETFCHHCEGRSDLIRLELWQKAMISVIFGIIDSSGNRQFREIMIVMGRKNGKSLFASAIADYCLFSDGEYGANVFCVAPKLDQADIIYKDIWQTVSAEPELARMIVRRKSDYYVAATNSSVKKIAFNAKKSDGFNPSLTICDEIASWQGDPGLKQYEVMKSALGARKQPLIISISTAGYATGIYDELFSRSTRMLLGGSKEKRLLPFLYTIDDVEKWADINELRKANPNLGVSVSVDYMLEEIAVAENSLSKRTEFLTKYCNIKQNSSQAFLSAKDIAKCCGSPLDLADYRSNYAICGIDLSRTTDLSACVCVIHKNGKENVFAKFFLPAEKLQDATLRDGLPYAEYIKRGFLQLSGENFIDYHDCFNWCVSLVEEYEILPLMIGYDRYSAQYLIQDLNAYGFHTDDVYQGFNLSGVCREFEGMVKDGRINIGDNDLLKIHLLNTAMKIDTETERMRPVKIGVNDHIDGCAALLDALTVRQKHFQELGAQLMNGEG